MEKLLFSLGDVEVTVAVAAYAAAAVLVAALLVAVLVISLRSAKARAAEAAAQAEAAEAARRKTEEAEKTLAHLLQVQSEMTGRMQTMAEIFGSRTSDLARLVNERLDAQSQKVGQAIEATQKKNEDSLGKLNERLAVIDRAQANITSLSKDVVGLQSILANKQTRGAFGQGRMESIVGDGLPIGAFAFQHTLSNNSRPDCVIFMPNNAPPLVIDAKFPLESWQRLGAAQNEAEQRVAALGFRQDMQVHIRAIAEKYLIAGETQDTAFLFVPSESIFADIHERFEDVVQRAARARVVIVSPSLLMLSIQVVQALLRDVRIREEAHKIQKEVMELLGDVGRLDERVRKLQNHFRQAGDDIGDIIVSSGKVTRRGERIASMEFDEPAERQRLAGE
ncbi:MAG: DNA recombinase [Devosia sp. 67-54]|uniref:DNA recombination protein RmuC n=1 Tax=unclassified Devosia TaxID=196773 RepID=UPI00095B4A7F|nr:MULTISPECIES: DNA recombination protein RmuC [unclassified Devosia]MBN9304486.1 DNA recombination protein RmuC [Devosia sp.]OJX15512.1 MAG: DNA recombinase [Devosia sp. 67-54]